MHWASERGVHAGATLCGRFSRADGHQRRSLSIESGQACTRVRTRSSSPLSAVSGAVIPSPMPTMRFVNKNTREWQKLRAGVALMRSFSRRASTASVGGANARGQGALAVAQPPRGPQRLLPRPAPRRRPRRGPQPRPRGDGPRHRRDERLRAGHRPRRPAFHRALRPGRRRSSHLGVRPGPACGRCTGHRSLRGVRLSDARPGCRRRTWSAGAHRRGRSRLKARDRNRIRPLFLYKRLPSSESNQDGRCTHLRSWPPSS